MERTGKMPLTEVSERTEGRIRLLNLEVPGIDPDNLQINANRTLTVMRWGGIGHLSLGSYEGGEPTLVPTKPILNADGTVSSTSDRVASKVHVSTSSQGASEGTHKSFNWRNVAVYINKEAGLLDANALDRAFRLQIIKNIWGNDANLGLLMDDALFLGLYSILLGSATKGIIVKTAAAIPLHIGVRRKNSKEERLEVNRQKLSSQWTWFGDRAILASAHLTRPLITPIR